MPRLSARLDTSQFNAAFSDWYRFAEQRLERAALIATDEGRRIALRSIRSQMQAAGLGRLGNAVSSTSDLEQSGEVHRRGDGGFSASGVVFVRSKSERTLGAIEAYTRGANIRPVRSRWLWIATDNIPRITGKYRMTPELYRANGFERKIGPLVMVRSVNGNPLLVVEVAGIDASGRKRSARSLTKSGRARKGQVAKQFVVAFIGIPHTARSARVDITALMREVQAELPRLAIKSLGRI